MADVSANPDETLNRIRAICEEWLQWGTLEVNPVDARSLRLVGPLDKSPASHY
jgi:hypothetical protein